MDKQRYLITGGAGFIGSHLAEFLLKNGNNVTVLDNFTSGSKNNLTECFKSSEFTCISGDACDDGVVENASEECDVIIHLAASVGVRKILADPAGCIENNLHSTEKVLKAAQKNSCRVFIASSSEVYGKLLKDKLSEEDGSHLGSTEFARWSYAAAKIMDEHLSLGFVRQRGLSVVIGRFFNVAGARQSKAYGMVIPRFISQAMRGEPLTVYDDGQQVRTFCSVHDVVRAVVQLCNSEAAFGQVFNIGANEQITIRGLAEKIIYTTQSASCIEYIPEKDLPAGFEEIRRRSPDISKIRSAIGWQPEILLDEIIMSAIAHQVENATALNEIGSGVVNL